MGVPAGVAVPALLSQWPPGPPPHNTVQHPVVRLDRHHGQGEEGRGQEGQGREEGGQQVHLRDLHVRVSVAIPPNHLSQGQTQHPPGSSATHLATHSREASLPNILGSDWKTTLNTGFTLQTPSNTWLRWQLTILC